MNRRKSAIEERMVIQSKNDIDPAFIKALHEIWEEHGVEKVFDPDKVYKS